MKALTDPTRATDPKPGVLADGRAVLTWGATGPIPPDGIEPGLTADLPTGLELQSLVERLESPGRSAGVRRGVSLEDAAGWIEAGCGVLLAVDAGELLADPVVSGSGQSNCLVAAVGFARGIDSGPALGFYIRQLERSDEVAGRHGPVLQNRFVEAATLVAAWLATGGWSLVLEAEEDLY